MSDVTRVAVPHLRLVFGGTLGAAGTEIWACSMKLVGQPPALPDETFAPVTGPDGALLPGMLERATTEINAIVDTGGQGGPNLSDVLNVTCVPAVTALWGREGRIDAKLQYVKLNAFGSNDRQLNNSTVEAQFAAVNGGSSTTVPWSTAAVAELRCSRRSRGFGSHARFSLPAGINIDTTTGKIASFNTRNQGGGADYFGANNQDLVDFLKKLNISGTTADNQFIPSIVYTSLPNHTYKTSGPRPPTFNPVDRAFFSDIPGEVRRRQNKLRQGQTPLAVAYSNTLPS